MSLFSSRCIRATSTRYFRSITSATTIPATLGHHLLRIRPSTQSALELAPQLQCQILTRGFGSTAPANERRRPPLHLVQHPAPDFTASAVFPDLQIAPLTLSSFKGQYVILFFYPLDFTFVCPTEIVAFSDRIKEFQNRHAQVIGVSVDSTFTHKAYRETPRDKGGIGNIQYPLVSDLNRSIARSYRVLAPDRTVGLRGLFLIDKEGIVRHMLLNDLPLGRSIDETLRMLDALQHFEKNGEVCPANWKRGKDAIAPTKEGVARYLGRLPSSHSNANNSSSNSSH